MRSIQERSIELLRKNRRTTNGHTYTVPSPGRYPYQWLWDSCFHAIVLAKFEPEIAIAELRSLLSRQLSNGLVPHMILWEPKITRPYSFGWGMQGTSSITQPPMIAYAAWEIYKHTNDDAFLRELFPRMLAYYTHLVEKRDPHDHHLASIINPDESGEDNSPRFDKPMHVPPGISFLGHMRDRWKLVAANRTCNFDAETCMHERFWVKDVPFNTIFVKNLDALARIASLIGEEKAEHFATLNAGLVREAMRERMFAEGVYWSVMGAEHEQLRVASWAHFMPLFADLYTKEEAEVVIRTHFSNTESFRSLFGIRTVSKQEPSYRTDGFWRGPVWFAPHWFIYKGLQAYGFAEEAKWIRDTSLELVDRHGFREYFNPETGAAYGARDFTWGTLVTDMIEE